jgi:hypothetical protein
MFSLFFSSKLVLVQAASRSRRGPEKKGMGSRTSTVITACIWERPGSRIGENEIDTSNQSRPRARSKWGDTEIESHALPVAAATVNAPA